MPKRVAVFGGTFDPIHEGHVQLALQFARRLKLDEVLLVPTFVPPHKLKADMAAAEDRLAMCRLVAAAHPKLKVSDMEITRGGASFTVDTLETLEGQYPGTEWYLITGADMFLTLGTWWRFEDIAELAVLCAPGGGDARPAAGRPPPAGGERRPLPGGGHSGDGHLLHRHPGPAGGGKAAGGTGSP